MAVASWCGPICCRISFARFHRQFEKSDLLVVPEICMVHHSEIEFHTAVKTVPDTQAIAAS